MPENPFDDPNGAFLVLVNQDSQHSLWPASIAVPDGWEVVYEGPRNDCLDHVDRRWKDIRPARLARVLEQPGARTPE